MSDLEAQSAIGSRPRLLYLDDEPTALSTLARVLDKAFAVTTTSDPMEALSLLERDGNFAVVVADVCMPDMNGLEFLELVKETSPTTTRVVVTGLPSFDPASLPREALFRALGKPCPPELLMATLQDAVSYHRLLACSPFQPVEPPRHELLRPRPVAGRAPNTAAFPPAGGEANAAAAVQPPGAEHAPAIALSYVRSSRVGLRVRGRTIELLHGKTVLGRSRACHIAINDPKISRRHAYFTNDGQTLTVRNASATNPLLVNGATLTEGALVLKTGDRITLGSQEAEVCLVGDYLPSMEPTERMTAPALTADAAGLDDAATLGNVSTVAEKYLRLGQAGEAERILRPLLEGLLRHCRSGRQPLASDVKLAVRLALDIAEANCNGSWISYVFDVLTASELPADEDALERLYRIVPTTPGISMKSYRSYVDVLARCLERFGPAQRFLVRRAQGLQSALLRSAHR
jgi:CheY-like chemotaxis protein